MMAQQQAPAGPSAEAVQTPPKARFTPGQLVDVKRRMQANSNIPGGVAFVECCNPDGTYNVKYTVIGGRENSLHAENMTEHKEETGRRARRAPKILDPALANAPVRKQTDTKAKKKNKKKTKMTATTSKIKAAATAAIAIGGLPVTFAAAARLKYKNNDSVSVKKAPCPSSKNSAGPSTENYLDQMTMTKKDAVVVKKKKKKKTSNKIMNLGSLMPSISRPRASSMDSDLSATSTPAVSPVPAVRPQLAQPFVGPGSAIQLSAALLAHQTATAATPAVQTKPAAPVVQVTAAAPTVKATTPKALVLPQVTAAVTVIPVPPAVQALTPTAPVLEVTAAAPTVTAATPEASVLRITAAVPAVQAAPVSLVTQEAAVTVPVAKADAPKPEEVAAVPAAVPVTAAPVARVFEYAIGAQVNVEEQTGPGVNKRGGIARVTKHNPNGTYAVRFVLGGSSSCVEEIHMETANLESAEPVARVRKRREISEVENGPSFHRQSATKPKKSKKDGKGKKRPSKSNSASSSSSSAAVSSPPKRQKTATEVFPSVYSPTTGAVRFGAMQYPDAVGHKKLFFAEPEKKKKKKRKEVDADGAVVKKKTKKKKKMKEGSSSVSAAATSSNAAAGGGAGSASMPYVVEQAQQQQQQQQQPVRRMSVAARLEEAKASYKLTLSQEEDAEEMRTFRGIMSNCLEGEMDGVKTEKLKKIAIKRMQIDGATFEKHLGTLNQMDMVFICDGSVYSI